MAVSLTHFRFFSCIASGRTCVLLFCISVVPLSDKFTALNVLGLARSDARARACVA